MDDTAMDDTAMDGTAMDGTGADGTAMDEGAAPCPGIEVVDTDASVWEVSWLPSALGDDEPWACGSQEPDLGVDVLLQITPEEDVTYRAKILNGFHHELRVLTACPADCADLPAAEPWATEYPLWLDAGTTYVIAASVQPMISSSNMPVGLRLEKMDWDPDAPGQGCDAPLEISGADLPAALIVSSSGLAPDLNTSCLAQAEEPLDFVVALTPDVTGTYDVAIQSAAPVAMVHSVVCEAACTAPWHLGTEMQLSLEAGQTTYFVVQANVPFGAEVEFTLSVSEVCVPQCDGKQCGDDGCGQLCGTCGSYLWCDQDTGTCELDELACYDDPDDPHDYPPGGCVLAANGCDELPVFVAWDYSYDYSSGSVAIPLDPAQASCDPVAPTALSFGWNSYHPGWVMVENGWKFLDYNAGELFSGGGGSSGPGDMLMEPWTVGPTVLKLYHPAAAEPVRVEFTWGGGVNLLTVEPWVDPDDAMGM